MTPRATKFLAAIRAIEEAHQRVEELQHDLFGYALAEVIAAGISIRLAERRLIALANLGTDTQDAA